MSLATEANRFPEGLERLEKSIRCSGFKGGTLFWQPGKFPVACPPHEEVPFAFKPYCFREADQRGMELVLWLDASCVVLRNLESVFRKIRECGYVLFGNRPHRVGEWISDEALEALGLDREQAMAMPEIYAGVIGLNLQHSTARKFLERWLAAAEGEVAFRGTSRPVTTVEEYRAIKWNREGKSSTDPRVFGHRHDQSAAGVIAHRLGMQPNSTGVQVHSSTHRWIRGGTSIVIDRSVGKKSVRVWPFERVRRDRYMGAFAQLFNVVRKGWR